MNADLFFYLMSGSIVAFIMSIVIGAFSDKPEAGAKTFRAGVALALLAILVAISIYMEGM